MFWDQNFKECMKLGKEFFLDFHQYLRCNSISRKILNCECDDTGGQDDNMQLWHALLQDLGSEIVMVPKEEDKDS